MKTDLKQTYKGNLVLHIAFILGIVINSAVFYYINNISPNPIAGMMDDMSKSFQYVAYIATILGYFGSLYFFKSYLEKARKEEGLLAKMWKFRTGNIIQLVLLEIPALLATTFYFLTNAYVFLMISGMLSLYMLLKLPVVSKIVEDLELSNGERKELEEAISS